MRSRGFVQGFVGFALSVVLVAGPGTGVAAEERGTWADAGIGVGTVLANVIYMPAKLVYATLGTVTGGLTYALTGGSYETAENVWVASLGGNYVVTPDMLTGERSVEFSGTPGAPGMPVASIQEETPSVAQGQFAPAGGDGYARDAY